MAESIKCVIIIQGEFKDDKKNGKGVRKWPGGF